MSASLNCGAWLEAMAAGTAAAPGIAHSQPSAPVRLGVRLGLGLGLGLGLV
jgi:hypothetical protein